MTKNVQSQSGMIANLPARAMPANGQHPVPFDYSLLLRALIDPPLNLRSIFCFTELLFFLVVPRLQPSSVGVSLGFAVQESDLRPRPGRAISQLL